MEKRESKLVFGIICSIVIIFICFIATKLWYLSSLDGNPIHDYSNYIKKLIPVLVTIIVFKAGSDALYSRDTKILKITYIAICLAEISLLIGQFILAVVFFAVCQILLTIRHYSGIREMNSRGATKKNIIKLVLIAVVIAIVIAFWNLIVFYPMLKGDVIFYAVLVYGLILGVSLWTALANYFAEYFPKKNMIMIIIGMIIFFISDFLVGLEVITKDIYNRHVIDIFVWITYVPAILLIALSSYKYKDKESAHSKNNYQTKNI